MQIDWKEFSEQFDRLVKTYPADRISLSVDHNPFFKPFIVVVDGLCGRAQSHGDTPTEAADAIIKQEGARDPAAEKARKAIKPGSVMIALLG